MKILVTGGSGFIGLHTVERMLSLGHSVRVLDSRQTGFSAPKGAEPLEMIEGDIRDPETCEKSCRGIEAVVHHAGIASIARTIKDPLEASEVNIGGTRNLLEAAAGAGVRRFIFSSSAKVYGSMKTYPSREDYTPNPETPYAQTKVVGEDFCREFNNKHGIETVSLRYFSVYGPFQNLSYGYIGPVIESIYRDEQPVLTGDEKVERDFTYIGDAVAAIESALDMPDVKFEVFNVGSGRSYTLKRTVDIVDKILGKDIQPVYKPLLPGMAKKTLADTTKMREGLDFRCKVDLEEGLKRTIDWYVSTRSAERK